MLDIKFAERKDIPLILGFIKELAGYEKLAHEVVATEEQLEITLFGDNPRAEVLLGSYKGEPGAYSYM